MTDAAITTRADLEAAISRIAFAPSGIHLHSMDLGWEIEELPAPLGWRVRLTFSRPDTLTGDMGRGSGRWEMIDRGTSTSGAIKTCWLLLELLVRHELMECFLVDGLRIFDPHRTVEQLKGAKT